MLVFLVAVIDVDIAALLSADDASILDSRLEDAETESVGATWMLRVRLALISPLELLTIHWYRPAFSIVAF